MGFLRRVAQSIVEALRMLEESRRGAADSPQQGEEAMVMAWEAARHNADVILENLSDGELPVDLESIAEQLDIRVSYRQLEPGMSGFIFKDEDRPAVIYINASDVEGRRRFTLAHELGHYVERMVDAKDHSFSFTDMRGTKYDLHEFYADEFAGALLMPKGPLLDLLEDGVPLYRIADIFGVTTPAVAKRLERLRKNRD